MSEPRPCHHHSGILAPREDLRRATREHWGTRAHRLERPSGALLRALGEARRAGLRMHAFGHATLDGSRAYQVSGFREPGESRKELARPSPHNLAVLAGLGFVRELVRDDRGLYTRLGWVYRPA